MEQFIEKEYDKEGKKLSSILAAYLENLDFFENRAEQYLYIVKNVWVENDRKENERFFVEDFSRDDGYLYVGYATSWYNNGVSVIPWYIFDMSSEEFKVYLEDLKDATKAKQLNEIQLKNRCEKYSKERWERAEYLRLKAKYETTREL